MTRPTKADIIPSLAVNRNVPKGKETHNIFSSVVIYSQLNAFIQMTFWNNGGRFFFYVWDSCIPSLQILRDYI